MSFRRRGLDPESLSPAGTPGRRKGRPSSPGQNPAPGMASAIGAAARMGALLLFECAPVVVREADQADRVEFAASGSVGATTSHICASGSAAVSGFATV